VLRIIWHRFVRHRLAVFGLIGTVIICLIAILAPYVSPYSYRQQNLPHRLESFSSSHWLGTDSFGRDVFSRLLWGARVSLSISLGAVSISFLVGLAIGTLSGFYGGFWDWVLMRFTDMFLCVPALFVIMILVAVFGSSYYMTIAVIAAVYWPATARLVRAEFLRLRAQDFLAAARAVGVGDGRLILVHLLPNAAAPLIVQITLQIAAAIVLESGLSYLGLGAQPPTPSWGNILADGHAWLRTAPWIATVSGVAIWVSVLCLNFLGDGLRDSLDPRLSRS